VSADSAARSGKEKTWISAAMPTDVWKEAFSGDSLVILQDANHSEGMPRILKWLIKKKKHRNHGAGINANIWGILMGSMLPYIAYMDPMGLLPRYFDETLEFYGLLTKPLRVPH
jgi:hypothetical protein